MTASSQHQWRINPYIGISNETFADPRLTFTAAGVLAVLYSKLRTGEHNLFSLNDLPVYSTTETQDDIVEALGLLVSLGYLMVKLP